MTAAGSDTSRDGSGSGSAPRSGPSLPAVAFAITLGLILALQGALAARCAFVTDDAFITFRYAERLAAGDGIAYNPPPFRSVEGYSELLWMLLLAGAGRLGASIPDTALLLSTIASLVTTGLLVGALRRTATSTWSSLGGALLVATLPAVSVWTTGGLATAAFTLAVFGLHVALVAAPSRLGSIAVAGTTALVVLLRIDGFAWAAVLLGLHVLVGRDRAPRSAIVTGVVALAAATAAYVGIRLLAHGAILPHTAVQKVGFDPHAIGGGLRYTAVSLLNLAALPMGVIAALLGGAGGRSQTRIAIGMVAVAGGYAVAVGGDFMPMGRHLLPAAPFAGLLGAIALDGPRRRGIVRGLLAVGIVASLATTLELGWPPRALTDPLHFRWSADARRTEVEQLHVMRTRTAEREALGRVLRGAIPAGTPLTVEAIGAVGYRSLLPILDQHGLVMHPDDLDPRYVRIDPHRSVGHRFVADPAAFHRFAPFLTGATLVDTPPAGLPPGHWVPENRTGWEMLALPVEIEGGGDASVGGDPSFLLLARDPALGRPEMGR